MKWLTLKQIKQQVRLELDFHDEDEKLTDYGESAEDTILKLCQRTYDDFISEYGEIPKPIVEASLMLVVASYEVRSPVTSQQLYTVGYGFDYRVKPYMRLVSDDGELAEVQTVVLGSDVKIAFTADLPDDLLLKDVNFDVVVYNNNQVDKQKTYHKDECIMLESGSDYVALVDTTLLGIGTYLLKLTVQIPDTDYQSGYRKEVVKINPHIKVTG